MREASLQGSGFVQPRRGALHMSLPNNALGARISWSAIEPHARSRSSSQARCARAVSCRRLAGARLALRRFTSEHLLWISKSEAWSHSRQRLWLAGTSDPALRILPCGSARVV
jgi:hypothetical protein